MTASSVNSVPSFFLLMKRPRHTSPALILAHQFPVKHAFLSVALEQPRVLADDFGRL